jgi:hypothetical protein
MKLRSLAALGLLLFCTATWAQSPAPRPWKPGDKPGTPAAPEAGRGRRVGKDGKPINLINGVPDTGQFLPDTAILGRIDDRHFSVLEFRSRWYAAFPLDRPKTDSAGRLEFLNSMVNKEVLAALAKEVDRPLTFEDRTQLRETRQQWLANVAFARLVADSAQPTEAEIQHIYQQRQSKLHLQHVVTTDAPTAERARADVLSKRLTWEAAVTQYSTARGDLGPGGDAGWVARDAFSPATALEVYDLQNGQVSGVFASDSGWEFVRVLERRPERQPGLEQLRKVILDEARSYRMTRRVEQVRAQVRERIGMVYDTTSIVWATAVFVADERARAASAQGTLDLTGLLPEFQPADTARVLARWKDGRYSLGDFVAAFAAVPVPQRGKLGNFASFRWTLDGFVLEPYMAELSVERGFDRDPLLTTQMARKEEQLRVEHLFADSVQSKVAITPQARRKYYQDHLRDFYTWQSVTYAVILRHSKEGADSLLARLKGGETAASVLRADSLAGAPSGSIRTMREDEHETFHKLLFEELKTGGIEVVGPDKNGDYAAVQKLAHDPGRQMSFQEVESLVDESVQNLEAERMLKEFIARHRAKHRVELHPERLMLVRLTDPLMD